MSSFDEQSRWETETVSTTRSGKSKSSKRGKSKERKRKMDFSLIEEAVKVSDVYGHSWCVQERAFVGCDSLAPPRTQ